MGSADGRRWEGPGVHHPSGDDAADRTTAPADAPLEAGVTLRMRSVSPDDRVTDVIALARREHLRVVTNGTRFALCSVIPAGWRPFRSGEYTTGSGH
jgi:hypothetical protein